jgi:uncharacterized protein with PhoU and TrkA domain
MVIRHPADFRSARRDLHETFGSLSIHTLTVGNGSPVAGKTLQELDVAIRVLAISRGNDTTIIPDIRIPAGDLLIVDATGPNIHSFKDQVTGNPPRGNAMTG